MAFTLKPTANPNTFSGTPGQPFTIEVTADAGTLVAPLHRYDGQSTSANPFSFPVATQSRRLIGSYVATDPAANVFIKEVDGAHRQILAQRKGIDQGYTLTIDPGAAACIQASTKKAKSKKAGN